MAVGIGLVFGVLRLVNFAYGQLIMAGAYTLAFTATWPVAASIAACFAVVVALSLLMERVVFRPLRGQSPAVMLVTTFAIAFMLQAIALLIDVRDGTIGEIATSIASLNQAITVAGVDVRKITIVAVVVAAVALGLLALLLARTTIGLHMRAAATDFATARLLGVRANRVIGFAVLLSGLLAATVAVILTVQFPLVAPDFALRETIVVLVGVVVGGIDRLWTATLGGFTIGFATGVINGALPDRQERLPALGRVRARDPRAAAPAGGPVRLGAAARPWSACEARSAPASSSRCPRRCVVAVGIASTFASGRTRSTSWTRSSPVAIVVAIYVFVGNSGVLSFGQISFVAVGAFAAGVMTIPLESKTGVLPQLFPLLRDHTIGNVASLLLAAAVGGAFAFLVGLPLMRLSGLAAGIATFAVLEITHNLLREWTRIGPGATTLSLVPETTGALPGDGRRARRDRRRVRLPAQPPRAAAARVARGRGGRAGVGVSVHRQRLWAFTLSGRARRLRRRAARAPARLDHDRAGLPRAHLPDAGDARRRRRLEPLGRRARRARRQRPRLVPDRGRGGRRRALDLPSGTRLVLLGAIMALMLILRPSGLTGGREFSLPRPCG